MRAPAGALFRRRYPGNNPVVDVNVPGLGFSGLPDRGKNEFRGSV